MPLAIVAIVAMVLAFLYIPPADSPQPAEVTYQVTPRAPLAAPLPDKNPLRVTKRARHRKPPAPRHPVAGKVECGLFCRER